MKGLLIIFMLTLSGSTAQGQHILLKGQTRDTTLAAVPFANVMAVDTITKEMKGFAVTDVKGEFQLRLEKGKVYELQVTFVGFIPVSQYLTLNESPSDPLIIIMREAINALDEVTVVAEMPVIVRGDTISYKAAAFTKGDERKLEDVLEELPGFNMRENGDIEVQGKRVDKLLVDGKEFFEGDTKLATKNIPADVVDRVQVLQNFNEIAPMQGLGNDQQLALNIQLKGDKKNMVFGDIEAGGGPEERFLGHANTFYYAPKTSLNFIGDGNNVGELALTLNDYFRMTGGLRGLASRSGTSYRVDAANLDIPVTDRNSAKDLTNYLGAFNISHKPSNKIRMSGFLIGFQNDIKTTSNSSRTYTQLEDQTQEELSTISTMISRSGLGRFSTVYTPNYNLQIDYNFFGKKGSIEQSMLRNSQLLSGNNQLFEVNDREPTSQNHQLRMFNALNERHIISVEANYNKEHNLNNRNLISEQPLFQSFFSTTNALLNLSQDQIISSSRLDGAINYYHILDKTTHLNGALGVNVSKQSLTSSLHDTSKNLNNLDQDLEITNRYFRLLYKKKWNKLTISPGISINNYTVKGITEETTSSQYLFPQVNAQYDFSSSHDVEFTYRQSIEFNGVEAYTEGYRLSRYNTLLFGNPSLNPALSHSVNVSYRNFNTYNFLNVFGGLNFQYINDGFANNQSLAGVENTLTNINTQEANRVFRGFATIEKRFNHFRISGSLNLSQTILNNRLEGQIIQNNNFTQSYNLDMSARVYKILSLKGGYSIARNTYSAGAISSTFINNRPNAGATLTFKGFRFESSYAFNRYINKNLNQGSSFDVLDASLSYRKVKSPWELKIQAFNLLDTRDVRRDSFTDNLISTYAYAIQKRYLLFSVKYDL